MADLGELTESLARVAEQRLYLEKLRRRASGLHAEIREATASAERLVSQLTAEERDVQRLEGASISALLASLLGTRDEKLYKERQEAIAARLRYDEACVHLERLAAELNRVEGEIAGLDGVEDQYRSLLAEKERVMLEGQAPCAGELERLIQLEQQATWHLKELREARSAGGEAGAALADVLSTVRSAGAWGVWDILGGGLISTAIKHSRIDEAREKLRSAQEHVSRFRRELRDVQTTLDVPPALEFSTLAVFADFFLDGLFIDMVVQQRINEASAHVQRACDQVSELCGWIDHQTAEIESEIAGVQRQRREHVEEYERPS